MIRWIGCLIFLWIAPLGAAPDSPILLIHGYGGSGSFWTKHPYIVELESLGAGYRGDLDLTKKLRWAPIPQPRAGIPAYSITLPAGAMHAFEDSGKRLEKAIHWINQQHPKSGCVLVGYSLGGVIARESLTREGFSAEVTALITISSPHEGTHLAELAICRKELGDRITMEKNRKGFTSRERITSDFSSLLQTLTPEKYKTFAQDTGNALEKAAVGSHLLSIELMDGVAQEMDHAAQLLGIDLRSEALRQLMPPHERNYLNLLNHRSHPHKVRYRSIVAQTDDLSKAPGQLRILQEARALFGSGPEQGDGLLSTATQQIENLPGVALSGADAASIFTNANHREHATLSKVLAHTWDKVLTP